MRGTTKSTAAATSETRNCHQTLTSIVNRSYSLYSIISTFTINICGFVVSTQCTHVQYVGFCKSDVILPPFI